MKDRDISLDFFKGICIISVVCIHSFDSSNNSDVFANFDIAFRQVFNFAVAGFIWVAGYWMGFSSLKSISPKLSLLKRRLSGVFVPYLIWTTFYLLIFARKNTISLKYICSSIFFGKASGQLYFIPVLIQLFLLTRLIFFLYYNKLLLKVALFINLSYIILIYFLASLNIQISFPYYAVPFMGWIFFYSLGIYIGINNDELILHPFLRLRYFLFTILIITLLSSIIEAELINSKFKLLQIALSQIKISSFLYANSIILLFIIYRKSFMRKNIVSNLGQISFGIFLTHLLFMNLVKKILPGIDHSFIVHLGIIFARVCIIIFLSWSLIKFLRVILRNNSQILKKIGFI
ncbi:MAG: acyltransferase [Candidatus Omnitrophica bacterium]|nr:acyltransferase [Candidatus Omnitrophota bacterium]